jgi:hypothetical protein
MQVLDLRVGDQTLAPLLHQTSKADEKKEFDNACHCVCSSNQRHAMCKHTKETR